LARLLDDYERRLVSDDRDRRLLSDYRTQCREWLTRAKQVMALSTAGHAVEASGLLRDPETLHMGERLNSAAADWIGLNEDLANSASRSIPRRCSRLSDASPSQPKAPRRVSCRPVR